MRGIERRLKRKLEEREKQGKRKSPFRYGRYRREKTRFKCG